MYSYQTPEVIWPGQLLWFDAGERLNFVAVEVLDVSEKRLVEIVCLAGDRSTFWVKPNELFAVALENNHVRLTVT